MITRHFGIPAMMCCAAILPACGSAKYEWSQAATLNTISAYQTFLSKYPNDAHSADARSRVAQLQDERAWAAAQLTSTADGYRQYLSAEPEGAHAAAARDEIASRERSLAWQNAQINATAQSLQEFLQKYPTGLEADRAREKLKVLAGYRAELGTARSEKQADRERDALSKQFGSNFPQVLVLEPDATSHDYRIMSAPMSETDANAACASVKRAGRSCKVVQATG